MVIESEIFGISSVVKLILLFYYSWKKRKHSSAENILNLFFFCKIRIMTCLQRLWNKSWAVNWDLHVYGCIWTAENAQVLKFRALLCSTYYRSRPILQCAETKFLDLGVFTVLIANANKRANPYLLAQDLLLSVESKSGWVFLHSKLYRSKQFLLTIILSQFKIYVDHIDIDFFNRICNFESQSTMAPHFETFTKTDRKHEKGEQKTDKTMNYRRKTLAWCVVHHTDCSMRLSMYICCKLSWCTYVHYT